MKTITYRTAFILAMAISLALHLTANAQYDEPPQNSTSNGDYLKAPARHYLNDKGVMLTPMKPWYDKNDAKYSYTYGSKLDRRRTLPYKLDKTCITLKLQKNFASTDESASPAVFNYINDATTGEYWGVDAAIRFDLWIPGVYKHDGAEVSIAFGYDIMKSSQTGAMVDLQSFHLAIPFVPKKITDHIPFLDSADQVFQLNISYDMDKISGEDGFNFETDYRPTLVFPFKNSGQVDSSGKPVVKAFCIGAKCGFDGTPIDPSSPADRPYYNIEPKFGVSYGDKYSLGKPIASLDQELVATSSLGVTIGAPIDFIHPIYRKSSKLLIELRYEYKTGTSLEDTGNFDYQQISLKLQPSESDNPFSILASYRKGENGFNQAEIDQFSVELGVRF